MSKCVSRKCRIRRTSIRSWRTTKEMRDDIDEEIHREYRHLAFRFLQINNNNNDERLFIIIVVIVCTVTRSMEDHDFALARVEKIHSIQSLSSSSFRTKIMSIVCSFHCSESLRKNRELLELNIQAYFHFELTILVHRLFRFCKRQRKNHEQNSVDHLSNNFTHRNHVHIVIEKTTCKIRRQKTDLSEADLNKIVEKKKWQMRLCVVPLLIPHTVNLIHVMTR